MGAAAAWPGGWGVSHRLGDVGLPPVRVLQGVALGVGQAPPAATGGRSQPHSAGAGSHRVTAARSRAVRTCHGAVAGSECGTHASQTSLSTEASGLVCEREAGRELGWGTRGGVRGCRAVPAGGR